MRNNIADAIGAAFDYMIANVHTAIPAIITAYDNNTKRAIVKPTIKRTYSNGKVLSMPTISNVPVVMPRNKIAGLDMPVNIGDSVLLIFSERSLERWLFSNAGDEVESGVDRKFDLTDAIAIIGLFPLQNIGETEDGALTLYNKKAKIKINKDSKIAIGNSDDELLNILNDFLTTVHDMTVGGMTVDPAWKNALINLSTRLGKIKGNL